MKEGIRHWNADIVEPTVITVSGLFKRNSTERGTSGGFYFDEIVVDEINIASHDCNRVTDLDATLAADEWRVLTGYDAIGQGSPPPFFRSTTAVTGPDNDTSMSWTVTHTYTIETIWEAGSGNPDTFDDYSESTSFLVNFSLSGQSLTWFAGEDVFWYLEDTFDVDIHTLKKSGNINFGFTKTETTSNPNPTIYTAWDWSNSVTVTCS